jgi:hypothetical protein
MRCRWATPRASPPRTGWSALPSSRSGVYCSPFTATPTKRPSGTRDPRGELDHGVYEILESGWIDELNAYNRASFGTAYITSNGIRHFFIGGKDSSAQFLAKSLSLDLFNHASRSNYQAALGEALRRLDQYPEP